MSVAKNIEITSTSSKSFEDAINQGIDRAAKTVSNIRGAWIKDQKINIDSSNKYEYQVGLIITFVLDEGKNSSKKKK